jgi:UDP-N-acetylmuramoyl-L-alanyl-D-glutamate--2,6-diaminopimelate ligase
MEMPAILSALSAVDIVPGRLQRVMGTAPFDVLVDYAHTDDALTNVLTALRPLARGKLIVVFGCGGDRDRTKRPRMAKVAQELADRVIVTSDNPRTEDPAAIIAEILAGFDAAGREKVQVEADRRKAIESAMSQAQAGDVVLLAGKGHENYQIIGKEKHHFDDVEVAREALGKLESGIRNPGKHRLPAFGAALADRGSGDHCGLNEM